MLVVTEVDAAAIRDVLDQEGGLSAAIELRRLFPGVADDAKTRACALIIAGWKPLPAPPWCDTVAPWLGSVRGVP